MRKIKKIIIVLLGVLMLMLTGCGSGSTVNTTLNIESNLTGNRNMQVVISQSTFSEYFSGSQDDLNSLITTYCPTGMTWTTETVDSNYVYNFVVDFTSVEDYTSKITDILGEEPIIEITCPDGVWVSGVYVSESFSSTDLLKWLSEAVVSEGLVSSSYASDIFGTGDTKVVHAGEENATSSQIYLDKIDYEEISAINIVTDVVEVGTYNRKVEFVVPEASMSSRGDAIREYMNGITPVGAECVENTSEGMTNFTVSGTQLNSDTITSFMKTVFGNDNYRMEKENVDDNFSPFVFNDYFVECIKLNNYVVGGLSTKCRYIVQDSDVYDTYIASNMDNLQSAFTSGDEIGYSGYSILTDIYYYGRDESELDFPVLVQKQYNAFDLSVSTARTHSGDWNRETVISFEVIPTEIEIETIMSKLNSLVQVDMDETASDVAEDTEELNNEEESETTTKEATMTEESDENSKEKNVECAATTISNNIDGEVWKVIIGQAGSREALNLGTEMLLKTDSDLYYANSGKFYDVKKNEAYVEKINYATLLGNTSAGFSSTYELDLGIGAKMDYCNYYDMDYVTTVDSGKLVVEGLGSNIAVEYVGTYIDILAIVFWCLIVLALLLLIWTMFVMFKKHQSARTEKVTRGNPFCMKCGAKREGDEVFCSQCGEKF